MTAATNKVANATTADWDFLQDDRLTRVIEQAAWSVLKSFGDRGFQFEDLHHDALLHVAVRPEMVERYRSDPPFLYREVKRALSEQVQREVVRQDRCVSLGDDEDGGE